MDIEADANVGESELFKGTKVWDVFECNTCNLLFWIYSNCVLNSSKLELSVAEQNKLVDKFEAYKDSYVYGNAWPVDHFETKRILRCSDFFEMQYFTFAKGDNKFEVDICCYYYFPDNLLSINKIK